MTLSLNNLQAPKGKANRSKKRVGRGNASGSGTYASRGLKGQKARAGVGGLKLKGMRRQILSMPKLRGFKSLSKKNAVVNLAELEQHFSANDIVSPKTLVKKGLVETPRFGVKILGTGKLSKALKIKDVKLSASAKEAVEKAGGSIETA